jgi:hypothetical protein
MVLCQKLVIVVIRNGGPNEHPNSKREQSDSSCCSGTHARRRSGGGGRCGCGSWRRLNVVDRHRVVLWDVNNIRVSGLDLDILLPVLGLCIDLHLRAGLKVSSLLCLRALPLHGSHDPLLVRLKCLSQLGGPWHLLAHVVDHLREERQVLHARTEAGSLGSVGQCISLEALILDNPVSAIEHFLWIGRRCKNLGEQLVGVEGDRSDKIVDADLGRLGLCL